MTPLINSLAARTTLYRTISDLIAKGWLESNGKDRYRTTSAGVAQLMMLRGEVPEGLVSFYYPLAEVPTPQHRAIIELTIAAIIARKFEIRPDRHPALILAGKTLKWKTSAAMFLCHMLALDPVKHIVNLAVESGQSLWLRKKSTGEINYQRELLKAPLFVFDEFHVADSHIRKQVGIFIDGRKRVSIDNEVLSIEPVPFITLNPHDGDSLEEQLRLNTAQLRRSIICNLNAVNVPDLALEGEGPIKMANAIGSFALRKPTVDCTTYKDRAYRLFRSCLNEQGTELVDFDMLLMLSTAMTGYFDPEKALLLVFYDAILLFQTIGWTLPGWRQQFAHLSLSVGAKMGLRIDSAEIIAKKHLEMDALNSKRQSHGKFVVEEDRQRTVEDIVVDDQLNELHSTFEEIRKKNLLTDRKIELKSRLEKERLKELENNVRNNPSEVATYAKEAFPILFSDLVRYVGRKRVTDACTKAWEKFISFEEWKKEHYSGGFTEHLREVIEGLVKEKKREHFLKKYSTNRPSLLICRKCKREEKEVQPEFSEDDHNQFVCPRCNGKWIWRCRVCSELEKHNEVDMQYNSEVGEMYCKDCGHHWPVYPLEWKGTAWARRSRIIEERRMESDSLDKATQYADSIVFPVQYQ